jgi:hypothetical protein
MITTAQVHAEQELASLCGVLNASYARLVAIVAAALEDESWAIAGVRSPEHWLTMRAGLSPFRAKAVIAVARRRSELPSVMDQFADGQLSLDQVTVVARYAPAHVEESVAEFAVNASVPQLRRALSHYSFDPPRPEGQGPQVTTFATDASQSATGDAGADDAGELAGDPPGWNGYALAEDRSGEPAELSMSHDEYGRFTMRFSAPRQTWARWSRPP